MKSNIVKLLPLAGLLSGTLVGCASPSRNSPLYASDVYVSDKVQQTSELMAREEQGKKESFYRNLVETVQELGKEVKNMNKRSYKEHGFTISRNPLPEKKDYGVKVRIPLKEYIDLPDVLKDADFYFHVAPQNFRYTDEESTHFVGYIGVSIPL